MEEKVKAILSEIRPEVDFDAETKLIDDEILDSFDIIQIIAELMEAFDVDIDADDIEPENLNSVKNIVELIEKKKNA